MKSNSVNPFFSIIIPSYNGGKRLYKCLHSVMDQTLDNSLYEIIVVDDGSTDPDTLAILNFCKNELKIQVELGGENSGSPVAPYNSGFLLSKGKYITFFDQDDTYKPTKLEEELAVIKEYEPDILWTNFKLKCGKIRRKYKSPIGIAGQLADSTISCAMIKSDFFKKVGGFSNEFLGVGDTHWLIRADIEKPSTIVLDRELIVLNKNVGNISDSLSERRESFLLARTELMEHYTNTEYESRLRTWACSGLARFYLRKGNFDTARRFFDLEYSITESKLAKLIVSYCDTVMFLNKMLWSIIR